MTAHDWFRENIALYVADGLPAAESRHLETHAAECGSCARELAQWRLFDRELRRLGEPTYFPPDWDDRVMKRWQVAHWPARRWSVPARWAMAAAALLFLGALGAAVMTVAEHGGIAFPGMESAATGPMSHGLRADVVADHDVKFEGRRSLGEKLAEPAADGAVATNGSLTVSGGEVARRLDLLQRSEVVTWHDGRAVGVDVENWGRAAFSPDGKEVLSLLGKQGKVSASDNGRGATTANVDLHLHELKAEVSESVAGSLLFGAGVKSSALAGESREASDKKGGITYLGRVTDTTTAAKPQVASPSHASRGLGFAGADGATTGLRAGKVTTYDAAPAEKAKSATLSRTGVDYYHFAVPGASSSEKESLKALDDLKREPAMEAKDAPASPEGKSAKEKAFRESLGDHQGLVARPELALVQQPKQDPPVALQRKIIRTGEMEFEVDDFEASVATINKLLDAIQGAFLATKNSDKLPNGKVKGSIVVRMPPEHLDKFTLDIRGALAKTGELKTQRIGSQDVSKQYTDIESRLRAARTMEDRLLNIIKSGKGEVKDLIAAEAQLGVWRTKIEEMEGEIRYYNNQIGLSTLTIQLVEKEIRAAASLVVSERVTMKIEADDVEKSLQAALAAVAEAKGRVTKSDLKQHAAGQLEAILHFEVAPAAAAGVKDKLKSLGNVTHHDAQRTQTAEGGPAPTLDSIKSKINDVRFDVSLYNVANIQPREAFHLTIAVADVPSEYRKLLDEVLTAKGQVRISQLDEKDRTNLNATLDFDVPSLQRAGFDQQLAGLGEIVSKSTTRAGATETATDRKIGYRLVLKSVTSIPPRETHVIQAYSLDVPAAFKKLRDAVAQSKGHVRAGQLNEQDKNNIHAQFDFDVPVGDPGPVEKLLDELTDVSSRTTNRLQPSDVATDRKVGYKITLLGRIPPRETIAMVLEVKDVEKVAAHFVAAARAAKGKVTESKVAQDAAGRAIGTQHFELPLTAKNELLREIRQAGAVRGQDYTQNLQAPESKLATAVVAVRLVNPTPIVPSDEGVWPQVRTSLAYAFRLLSMSLMFLIVGISVLLPWALMIWLGVKMVRKMRGRATT